MIRHRTTPLLAAALLGLLGQAGSLVAQAPDALERGFKDPPDFAFPEPTDLPGEIGRAHV